VMPVAIGAEPHKPLLPSGTMASDVARSRKVYEKRLANSHSDAAANHLQYCSIICGDTSARKQSGWAPPGLMYALVLPHLLPLTHPIIWACGRTASGVIGVPTFAYDLSGDVLF